MLSCSHPQRIEPEFNPVFGSSCHIICHIFKITSWLAVYPICIFSRKTDKNNIPWVLALSSLLFLYFYTSYTVWHRENSWVVFSSSKGLYVGFTSIDVIVATSEECLILCPYKCPWSFYLAFQVIPTLSLKVRNLTRRCTSISILFLSFPSFGVSFQYVSSNLLFLLESFLQLHLQIMFLFHYLLSIIVSLCIIYM